MTKSVPDHDQLDPDVVAAWDRVAGWLRENAPGEFAALRPGASAADITAIADDYPVHPQLATLLTLCDGTVGPAAHPMVPSFALLPSFGMLRAAAMRPLVDAPAWEPDTWQGHWWVVIATSGTGEYLVLDHRPGPGYGAVLLVDYEGAIDGEECWSSLLAMFEDLAEALEPGGTIRVGRQRVEHRQVGHGHLEWDVIPTPRLPQLWLRHMWEQADQRLKLADPSAYASLRGRAEVGQIRAVQSDGRLPNELWWLLQIHDGAKAPEGFRVFPGGYRPYSCEELTDRLSPPRSEVTKPEASERDDDAKSAGARLADRFIVMPGETLVGKLGVPDPDPTVPDPDYADQVPRAALTGEASPLRWVTSKPRFSRSELTFGGSGTAEIKAVTVKAVPFAVSENGDELYVCVEPYDQRGAVMTRDSEGGYRTAWADLATLVAAIAR